MPIIRLASAFHNKIELEYSGKRCWNCRKPLRELEEEDRTKGYQPSRHVLTPKLSHVLTPKLSHVLTQHGAMCSSPDAPLGHLESILGSARLAHWLGRGHHLHGRP